MKKFFEPEIEVIKFSTEDVITTSFVEDNDSEEAILQHKNISSWYQPP